MLSEDDLILSKLLDSQSIFLPVIMICMSKK